MRPALNVLDDKRGDRTLMDRSGSLEAGVRNPNQSDPSAFRTEPFGEITRCRKSSEGGLIHERGLGFVSW